MSEKLPAIIEIENNGKIISFQGMFERPVLECEKESIPYMTFSTWVRNQVKWSNSKIYFLDFYNENSTWVNDWMKEISNFITGEYNNMNSYKKNINIKCFHKIRNKSQIETWKLTGAFIQSYNMNVIYDFNKPNFIFPEIFFDRLTRTTLIEKKNNPMIQTFTEIELIIDNALLLD